MMCTTVNSCFNDTVVILLKIVSIASTDCECVQYTAFHNDWDTEAPVFYHYVTVSDSKIPLYFNIPVFTLHVHLLFVGLIIYTGS